MVWDGLGMWERAPMDQDLAGILVGKGPLVYREHLGS